MKADLNITFYKEEKFKETPIGKIPEDWEVVDLGEICAFESGKRPKGGAKEKGDILSIGGEHIDDSGYLNLSSPKFISKAFYDSLQKGILQIGDIIMCKDGAKTGKVAYIRELKHPATVNEHIFIIRNRKPEVLNQFIFYCLLSFIGQNQIKAFFHGIIGGITSKDLSILKNPLPPLEEQKAITHILSTVDEAIQKTDEIIEKTERLKKGLMQELLMKGIGHKEFKDTEIGRIPKEWEVVRLSDIVMELKPGFACGRRDENGVIQLRMDSIRIDGWIDTKAFVKIPIPDCINVEEYLVEPGDILFTNTSGSLELIGKTALYRGEFEKCVYSNHLTRIRVKEEIAMSEWVFYVLLKYWSSGLFKVLKVTQAGGQKSVGKNVLLHLKIPLPSINEQERITKILSTVDKRFIIEEKRKEKLERIKKALMDLLLTGKIRVKT